MILFAQTFATSEVCFSRGLVQTTDGLYTTLAKEFNSGPIGSQSVGQKNISRFQDVPHSAEQADFPLSLASVPAESEVEN